jgi:hypothetical protein
MLMPASPHQVAVERPIADRIALRASIRLRALAAAVLVLLIIGGALFEILNAQHSSPLAAARHRLAPHRTLSGLPMAAQGVVSAALGANSTAYRIYVSRTGFQAQSAAQGFLMGFGRSGVQLRSGTTQVGLSLQAWGTGASLQPVSAVRPSAEANRVTYARAGLSEWYRNGPLGLEQGFTIFHAHSGHASGPLTLSLALSGNAHAALSADGRSVTLSHAGASSLRYSGLRATDGRGHTLKSWLEMKDGGVLLRVNARGAQYPLRIDPFIQQGGKLTSEGGYFGSSAALSADGDTALVGATSGGTASVFTRSGTAWTQQAKLTVSGETGSMYSFGKSVALSADGDTALIGAPEKNAAWVFTRSGTAWTQQSGKLIGGGQSVALSSDGNTALVGGPRNDTDLGAASVFRRSGSIWRGQAKLMGGGEVGQGRLGDGVALSSDGNTALVGGPYDDGQLGAVWIFARSGTVWTQQGEKLAGSGGGFGESVALSSDGNTALIGAPCDLGGLGSASVFTRSGTAWTQQGERFTGAGETHLAFCERFGEAVALAASGETALIGGPGDGEVGDATKNRTVGAAWVFTRSGTVWTQQGEKLTGAGKSGYPEFGTSAALAADGDTALIGGPNDNVLGGAAWVFVNNIPRVATEEASSLTQTSATLNATVDPNGESVSDCHFEYGTSLSYGSSVACTTLPGSGEMPVAVSASVGGLTKSTTYHFRIVATNPTGTNYGVDDAFTTPPSVPTVVTEEASSLTQTSATLNATVDPNGEPVSDCHFEYGASLSYGSSMACTTLPGSGVGLVPVSASVGSLNEGTNYHFRIVAANAGTTSYGSDQTFTTNSAPEFGKCVKVSKGRGKYENSGCTKLGGTKVYEWYPGVPEARFATKGKELTTVTLQPVQAPKVTCNAETGVGEYFGFKTVRNVLMKFTGCERLRDKCTSADSADGEIATNALSGELGIVVKSVEGPIKNKIGLDLKATGSGLIAEFSCGTSTDQLRGSVIAKVKTNVMVTAATLKYTASKGVQNPTHFEGRPNEILEMSFGGGPFEQTGLTLTTIQTNEERVEVNAVV